MTYNGWVNYPTWAVHLWISNEEFLWDTALEIAADARLHSSSWRDGPDAIKNWVVDELVPDLGASMPGDILGWAFDQVDWTEVFDAITEALPELEDDDEAE